LLEDGYSPTSVTRSLTALGHLGRWMQREGVVVERLDDDAVSEFIDDYVKHRGQLPAASVRPLLAYLHDIGAAAEQPSAPRNAVERLIADYRAWLGDRELAPVTVSITRSSRSESSPSARRRTGSSSWSA
jgi:hypothetical protein